MLIHYLKVALRNLLKYKTQTTVSIIGLAFGLACFALSSLWIRYIMTYDDFHQGAGQLYLAETDQIIKSNELAAPTSGLLPGYLKNQFPEIEVACHFYWLYNRDVATEQVKTQMDVLEIDSAFISLFHPKTVDGNGHFYLNSSEVAITRQAAQAVFGDASPIGQPIYLGQSGERKVVGAIVEGWGEHTNIPFDLLVCASEPHRSDSWNVSRGYTLLRLRPDADIASLRTKLQGLKVHKDNALRDMPVSLTPLTALRYTHPIREVTVKLDHVRLFALIGGLVIACGLFNYLILYGIRIRIRRRELALRKVNGASDGSIVALLFSELLLLLLVALLVGMLLIELSLPLFKTLSQIEEGSAFFYKESALYLLLLAGGTFLLSLFWLRYIHRGHTLQHHISGGGVRPIGHLFRRAGLLFQLMVSMGFIFCTGSIMKQLHFLRTSSEIGWERRNIGTCYLMDADATALDRVLPQIPTVVHTLTPGVYSAPIPKTGILTYTLNDWDNQTEESQPITFEEDVMGEDYMEFFRIQLLRGSIPDSTSFKGKVLINETAAKAFGWDDPIGKKISSQRIVQGVIKDIHYNSPVMPVMPVVYVSSHDPQVARERQTTGRIFKFEEGTWQQTVAAINAAVLREYPGCRIRTINLAEEYDKYLKSEDTLMKLLSAVSVVCVVISVFGIFSLVTLSCERRRKEMAVRKVNGASARIIGLLFVKEYLWLLLIASAVSFPVSYTIMQSWLTNYVKQTSLDWWMYVALFAALALLILLTVGWRVWKAARQNPADIIKSE